MTPIEITAEDLRNGKSGEPAACPLAIASTRHLKAGYYASVGTRLFAIRRRGGDRPDSPCTYFPLPLEATRFVDAFDGYTRPRPEPCTIELGIPAEYLIDPVTPTEVPT